MISKAQVHSRHEVMPFEISLYKDKVIISGDLDGSTRVIQECKKVFSQAARHSQLIIEADHARIVPEGVDAWVMLVRNKLSNTELIYAPSQLGLVLLYTDEYDHPQSTFQDAFVATHR